MILTYDQEFEIAKNKELREIKVRQNNPFVQELWNGYLDNSSSYAEYRFALILASGENL